MERIRVYIIQAADAFALASIFAGLAVTTAFFALSFLV